MFRNLPLLFTNKILLFTANRYFCYFLSFIRGILVAKFLGPYFFGIWGFIQLILNYLSYTSLGIGYAVNVELSTNNKNDKENIAIIVGNSMLLTFFICLLLICIVILVELSDLKLFPSYSFSQYALFAALIACLNHITQVFANIYRAHGFLFRIAISELLLSILTFVCVFIFTGAALIEGLLFAMTSSGIVSIILYLIKRPIQIKWCISSKIAKQLLSKGLSLLFYNMSFYFIMITGRTIVSIFYSVEEMGYFSLANSITSAMLLGLGSITWVLFPKFLWMLRPDVPVNETKLTISKVTIIFSFFAYVIVFGAIMLAPLLFLYLPKYRPLASALNYLLLSQAIFSSCIAYNSIAIARNKQMAVAKVSLMSVSIVAVTGTILAFMKVDFTWIACSTLVAICFFSVLQTRLGEKLVGEKIGLIDSFKKILPLNFLLPISVIAIGNLLSYKFTGVIGFITLIIFNYRNLCYSFHESKAYFLKGASI